MGIDELYPCADDGIVFYTESHVPRRKFVGAVLSYLRSGSGTDTGVEPREVVTARFRQGWWGDFDDGDGEWCDAPRVTRATRAPGDTLDAEADAPIIGTVRPVTWVEVGEARMGEP